MEEGSYFKTRLCKYFEMGECLKGDACTYAHGPEELSRVAGSIGSQAGAGVLMQFPRLHACEAFESCRQASNKHGERNARRRASKRYSASTTSWATAQKALVAPLHMDQKNWPRVETMQTLQLWFRRS